ncbi:MAG: TIGR00725 family protein [Deltaproteobacteria bacterium]|nr:TIGR00725 family protein [Deltaproteobacteria bacterium]
MSASRYRSVAVCGTGESEAESSAAAEAIGFGLVEAGLAVICGGLAGVMEAVARGGRNARDQGASGLVIGILPGEDHAAANRYCDLVLPSGLGIARNALIVRAAEVVVLVAGGAGTLSEAALAWQLDRPLIAYCGAGGWSDRLAGMSLDHRPRSAIAMANSAEQVVRQVVAALARLEV